MAEIIDWVGRIRDYLESAAIVERVGTEVPSERFDYKTYLVVRQTSGTGNEFLSKPFVQVYAHAPTVRESRILQLQVEQLMLNLPTYDAYISRVETNTMYEDVWTGTATRDATPGYSGLYFLTVNR